MRDALGIGRGTRRVQQQVSVILAGFDRRARCGLYSRQRIERDSALDFASHGNDMFERRQLLLEIQHFFDRRVLLACGQCKHGLRVGLVEQVAQFVGAIGHVEGLEDCAACGRGQESSDELPAVGQLRGHDVAFRDAERRKPRSKFLDIGCQFAIGNMALRLLERDRIGAFAPVGIEPKLQCPMFIHRHVHLANQTID